MAMTDYTYTKSVNVPKLESEIAASTSIITGLHAIVLRGTDSLTITMKAALSEGEEAALNALVAAHVNTPSASGPIAVEVVEDRTNTVEGSFQGSMWKWNIPECTPGTWIKLTSEHEVNGQSLKFPFPVSFLSAEWIGSTAIDGDEGRFVAAENTIVGVLAENAAENDTVLTVSSTVVANVSLGVIIKIAGMDLGRVVAKNSANSTITVETPVGSAGITAGPTQYVYMTKEIARKIYFDASPARTDFGGNRIGGTLLPAGKECNLYWKNNNGAAKSFGLYIEYII